jgi:hypothetical protein
LGWSDIGAAHSTFAALEAAGEEAAIRLGRLVPAHGFRAGAGDLGARPVNRMLKPLAPLPDRRRMVRTHVPGPLRWERVSDGSRGRGEMRTLSSSGISFVTAAPIAVGEELFVEVRGGRNDAPALRGRMGVLRVEEVLDGFSVAGSFVERLTAPAS